MIYFTADGIPNFGQKTLETKGALGVYYHKEKCVETTSPRKRLLSGGRNRTSAETEGGSGERSTS